MLAGLLAVIVVSVGEIAGWHGVDTAAAVYRIDSYHTHGFELWSFAWYGGHWTLGYSVIYPPLASAVGIAVLAVASAGLAAVCFDRIARVNLGSGAAVASYLFALGTLVQSSIGQLPFLTGEAFGLVALWALTSKRRVAAFPFALACTLSSPLGGAFLALCVAAWVAAPWTAATHPDGAQPDSTQPDSTQPDSTQPASSQPASSQPASSRSGSWRAAAARSGPWRSSRVRLAPGVAMIALALIPVIAAVVMFPGDGPMPYPVTDWVWEMVVAGIVAVLAGRHCPALTAGAVMWAVVATGAVAIPSAMGGNIGRIEDVAALPLAVGLAWQRPLLRDRLIVAAAAVALALSEWTPAVGAITVAPGLASTHRAFYAPLNGELAALASNAPAGRVEVVPTEYHWEAAYVAPVIPLARGWERQLDTADNPIFYQPGLLYPASYRAWLLDNGVRFVALAHAPLDFAAVAEAQLISSGAVPGLKQVWADSTWTLYKVSGATGIVSGPARLVRASADSIAVDVTGTGDVTIRVRFSPDWTVSGGSGCVTEVQGSWIGLRAVRPGLVTLRLSLLDPGASACR